MSNPKPAVLPESLRATMLITRMVLGMSYKELARQSGVSDQVLARMETGRCDPHASSLLPALEALGLTVVAVPMAHKAQTRLANANSRVLAAMDHLSVARTMAKQAVVDTKVEPAQ